MSVLSALTVGKFVEFGQFIFPFSVFESNNKFGDPVKKQAIN